MPAQAHVMRPSFEEIRQDPSLVLALGTGMALTAFLAVAHACCLGFSTPDMAALLQICTFAG